MACSAATPSHIPSHFLPSCALDCPTTNNRGNRAMVFKTQGDENLDAVVNVRLTSSEKQMLKSDAELAGIGMSELVRSRYFGKQIIANADAVMLRELRRIGGLLKHLHNENDGVYSVHTSDALIELRKYMKKLNTK
jgi:uncharacterized protein (DUF1778 family)